jgi:hypothetical protein
MNVNIYLEDTLAQALAEQAKLSGQARNTLIRIAIREWLAHCQIIQWPHLVESFKGVNAFPAFEDYRDELTPPKEDPFA